MWYEEKYSKARGREKVFCERSLKQVRKSAMRILREEY